MASPLDTRPHPPLFWAGKPRKPFAVTLFAGLDDEANARKRLEYSLTLSLDPMSSSGARETHERGSLTGMAAGNLSISR